MPDAFRLPLSFPARLCALRPAGLACIYCIASLPPPGVRQWEAAVEGDGGAERALQLFILQGPFPLRGSQLAASI